MIYLDVTSAAASSMNTGVQRSIRGLHALLSRDREVKPVRWDFSGGCYATLSSRELRLLTVPFDPDHRAEMWPGFFDWIRESGALRDRLDRVSRRMSLDALLSPGDLLLIPDLCWDARVHSWGQLKGMPGKKVAIFHDAMPLRIKGQPFSRDDLFAEYVRKLALMDLVICVSSEVESDLLHYWKRYGFRPKPTTVLPWPVPFRGPRPVNTPNYRSSRLIYISRLRLRKNHLVLLEACQLLWERGMKFSLDLIGIADTIIDTSRILYRMKKLAAKGRPVRWLRHVSDEELHRAYQDCAFTLFPSRMEGFGLPILESLWHRRPVICGSNGAIGEVSSGGGCLQVDQNDPEALARGMESLLSNEDLYNRLYCEANRRVFRSWEDYGIDLDKVLQEVGVA